MALPSSLSLSLSHLSLAEQAAKRKRTREENRGSRNGDRVCAVAGPLDVAGAVIVESDEFLAACTRIYQAGGAFVQDHNRSRGTHTRTQARAHAESLKVARLGLKSLKSIRKKGKEKRNIRTHVVDLVSSIGPQIDFEPMAADNAPTNRQFVHSSK